MSTELTIKFSGDEVALVEEYQRELSKPTIDNVPRIVELQKIIAVQVAGKFDTEKMFNRITGVKS